MIKKTPSQTGMPPGTTRTPSYVPKSRRASVGLTPQVDPALASTLKLDHEPREQEARKESSETPSRIPRPRSPLQHAAIQARTQIPAKPLVSLSKMVNATKDAKLKPKNSDSKLKVPTMWRTKAINEFRELTRRRRLVAVHQGRQRPPTSSVMENAPGTGKPERVIADVAPLPAGGRPKNTAISRANTSKASSTVTRSGANAKKERAATVERGSAASNNSGLREESTAETNNILMRPGASGADPVPSKALVTSQIGKPPTQSMLGGVESARQSSKALTPTMIPKLTSGKGTGVAESNPGVSIKRPSALSSSSLRRFQSSTLSTKRPKLRDETVGKALRGHKDYMRSVAKAKVDTGLRRPPVTREQNENDGMCQKQAPESKVREADGLKSSRKVATANQAACKSPRRPPFKARPLNPRVLLGPSGSKGALRVQPARATVPRSPEFVKRFREAKEKKMESLREERKQAETDTAVAATKAVAKQGQAKRTDGKS